uniref:Uncharacterized protein n=1 Tax=Siphoviridae sp. ctZZK17 TaxID=2826384 RepID=A0A8S5MNU4_9CAUD|nr:MAG TPA: hypothetical protein [Siphoviridae sp. ctZZK17]
MSPAFGHKKDPTAATVGLCVPLGTVMNINTISQFTQTVKPAGLRKEGGAPCLKLLMSLPRKRR